MLLVMATTKADTDALHADSHTHSHDDDDDGDDDDVLLTTMIARFVCHTLTHHSYLSHGFLISGGLSTMCAYTPKHVLLLSLRSYNTREFQCYCGYNSRNFHSLCIATEQRIPRCSATPPQLAGETMSTLPSVTLQLKTNNLLPCRNNQKSRQDPP